MISKLDPRYTVSLGGFDRRGAVACISQATATGFQVSGCWGDQADFATLYIWNADDLYGHLFTSRYLPDFSLSGVTLDFDLLVFDCMPPNSSVYQSVPWGHLSYITSAEVAGTVSLPTPTGSVGCSGQFQVGGTPTAGDIVTVSCNAHSYSYTVVSTDTPTSVAAALAGGINTAGLFNLTATSSGVHVTLFCSDPYPLSVILLYNNTTWIGDGLSHYNGAPLTLSGGGGTLHYHLDFTVLGLASCRQIWLVLAPVVNQFGYPTPQVPFRATFSNWTVVDPGSVTPLHLAGPGSVTIGSQDPRVSYAGAGWVQQSGFYFKGFSEGSSEAGDTVTIVYSCQSSHSLYLGTTLSLSGGLFNVAVDHGAAAGLSTVADALSPFSARRLIGVVAPGTHIVTLTVVSGNCTFDFLQAAVLSGSAVAATTNALNAACDFDTDQTYKIPPVRALWVLSQLGYTGDIDFYAGVFFALKRIRNGGNFHQAVIALVGSYSGANAVTVNISGDVTNISAPFLLSCIPMAAMIAETINNTSVGVFARAIIDPLNGAAATVVVTCNSPVYGFTLTVTSTGTVSTTGDIGLGNEGTWAVDDSQTSPLNQGFQDYLADFASLIHAAGQTMTVAFSQELLAPPDSTAAVATVTFGFFNYFGTGYSHTITIGTRTYTHVQLSTDGSSDIAIALAGLINADINAPATAVETTNNVALTSKWPGDILCTASDGNGPGTLHSGIWSQRFSDGTSVLTATGFGSWGAGTVTSVVGSGPQTINQPGHGYITGNTVHVAQGANGAVWSAIVVDMDHWQPGALISGTAFTIVANATTLIDLQTSQCTFNPATVTPYMTACYKQAAVILAAASLVPWLQFGEVGWWFYSRYMSELIGYASWTSPISVGTPNPHNLTSGQTAIIAGVKGNTAANGTWPIVVTDSTHFTLTGSSGNGTYTSGGTVSGGGMALYDTWAVGAHTLGNYWTQDDVPSGGDATWLSEAIRTHISSIITAVLAAAATSKFELLYPHDVNVTPCYYTKDFPYPQGGRLNTAMNFPVEYQAPGTCNIDRLKIEGLSWGDEYSNLDMIKKAVRLPFTSPNNWPKASVAYLIPVNSGKCPWPTELAYVQEFIPLINYWAIDQIILLSWTPPTTGFGLLC
jgi:hypothetical protein